jgi:Tfp pilus assembly protein PilE
MSDYMIFVLFVAIVALVGSISIAKYYSHKAKVANDKLMVELAASNERERERRRNLRLTATAPYKQPVTAKDLVSRRTTETSDRRRYVDDRPVGYTDDSDILTAMILQNALNSSSDTTSGSVRWDNDTPTITPTPSYESSSSSSYSSYSSSDSSSSYSSDSSSDSSSSSSCD